MAISSSSSPNKRTQSPWAPELTNSEDPLPTSAHSFLLKSTPPAPNSGQVSYGFQQMGVIRPTHLHQIPVSGGGVKAPIPVLSHPKVTAFLASGSLCNVDKDKTRDRNTDSSLSTVRDRKVRVSDGASLYALCRSWLRNGSSEEIKLQYVDRVKSLPRPLTMSGSETHSPGKMGGDNKEEEEGDVDQISPEELLQRHIKRAKRVRARLREERLQRISRCKTRLALLLPPRHKNDTDSCTIAPLVA